MAITNRPTIDSLDGIASELNALGAALARVLGVAYKGRREGNDSH